MKPPLPARHNRQRDGQPNTDQKRNRRAREATTRKTKPLSTGIAITAALALLTACGAGAPPEAPANSAKAVILIPGLGGNTQPLEPIRKALVNKGHRVIVADIGDGQGDLAGYAQNITQTLTPYGQVSIVGYSAGGVIARAINQQNPQALVRVVTIASPHKGSGLAQLGALFGGSRCSVACRQLAPGSDFLNSLETAPDNGTWLSLWTENDEAVAPASNSELDGAINLKVQDCGSKNLTHGTIVTDSDIVTTVVKFIDGQVPQCAK